MPEVLWTICAILGVLMLVYLLTRYAAGRGRGGGPSHPGKRMLTISDQVAVGKDQRLLLVRVGETYYFLGATQRSIACLEKLTAEEIEAWMGGADGTAASKMEFQETLHSALEQRKQQRRPQPVDAPINVNGENVQTLQILFLTTLLTLLPSAVVMMTSFTRYIVSFSFLRSAMGLQQNPPNMILVGIALFLTLFTMSLVISEIQTIAYKPYIAEEITQEEFLQRAEKPLKEFMAGRVEEDSLKLYCNLAGLDIPSTTSAAELPLWVLVPAFMTNELKHVFLIGFYLYIPFVLIDVIVVSVLMSMGMIMLPPSMISMPLELLLFIVLNGWELLFSTLVQSFRQENPDMEVVDILQEGVGVALRIGTPLLILNMLVGILVAIFQAIAQVHEQSLLLILKTIVVVTVLLVSGGWILETLLDFSRYLFTLM